MSAATESDEFAQWHEDIKRPEYRFRIFAMLAFASAWIGDEDRANEYAGYAEQERAEIDRKTSNQ